MATPVTLYVNTASSGGDGTTNNTSGSDAAFAGWRAAMTAINTTYSGNLVTADVQVTLLCSGSTQDNSSSSYTVPTITMDATRNVITRPNTGQEHGGKWNTSVYRLGSSNSTQALIATNAPHLVFEDVQLYRDHSSASASHFFTVTTPSAGWAITLRGCVAHWLNRTATPTAGALVNVTGLTERHIRVENCVWSGRWFHAVNVLTTDAASRIRFANNTVVGAEGGFIANGVGSQVVVAYNNVVIQSGDATAACYNFGGSLTTAENASSDATGDTGHTSASPTWTDAGTFEYRPAIADTALRGLGKNLLPAASDPDFSFSDDVAGNTRTSTFDIGAWLAEPSAGGSAASRRDGITKGLHRGLAA